jgi:hypothetical protein
MLVVFEWSLSSPAEIPWLSKFRIGISVPIIGMKIETPMDFRIDQKSQLYANSMSVALKILVVYSKNSILTGSPIYFY